MIHVKKTCIHVHTRLLELQLLLEDWWVKKGNGKGTSAGGDGAASAAESVIGGDGLTAY